LVAAADEAVASAFRAKGWSVLTKGWPDLLCYDRELGKIMAVELKRGADKMRPDQIEMQRVFTDMLSIPFHVARDAEIQAVMKNKGRVVAPGQSLTTLERRLSDIREHIAYMERQPAILRQELSQIEAAHNEATLVFDEVAPPNAVQAANWLYTMDAKMAGVGTR
jgi:hypothetical protein